jgi:hypothetical protein
MNRNRGVLTALAAAWLAAASAPAATTNAPARIGVFDSRAIAVAALGSDYYTRNIEPVEKAYRDARAAGDEKRMKVADAVLHARQTDLHRQAFSTAPVTDLLQHIKSRLPEIVASERIGALVSKWDATTLARYPDAEQVDVTMALVDAFRPTDKQRQYAIDIQNQPPVPLDTLDRQLAEQEAARKAAQEKAK